MFLRVNEFVTAIERPGRPMNVHGPEWVVRPHHLLGGGQLKSWRMNSTSETRMRWDSIALTSFRFLETGTAAVPRSRKPGQVSPDRGRVRALRGQFPGRRQRPW